MVSSETVEKTQDKNGLLQRLWVHENMRVYADRLINEEDKQLFMGVMKDTVQQVSPNFIDFSKNAPDQIIK